jgi:uncharacterized protein
MSNMDSVIPLFPLELVIFPGSKYPLHIFEPRYKSMIKFCLENKKGFGIVAKIGKDISSIGCYVKIDNILKHYENGEYDIVVEGQNRYLINKFEKHENGYYIADVNEYHDTGKGGDQELLTETKGKFEEVLKKINIELDEAFWKNFLNSGIKSFKIAEKSGLTLTEQQELLILQDENARLKYLLRHFERLNDQLETAMTDKILTMNDGYIN